MFFYSLVVGILLFPKVDTLKCYECLPKVQEACTNTQRDCSSQDHQCVALTLTAYTGGSKNHEVVMKNCSSECVSGSVNFGSHKRVISGYCCTTDLCNAKAAEVGKRIPNGKKCFSCEGQKCTRTLNCEADEDYCITSTLNINGRDTIMKGCASKFMCLENTSDDIVGLGSSCCQGNYCNSASRTNAGLLLMLALQSSFFGF